MDEIKMNHARSPKHLPSPIAYVLYQNFEVLKYRTGANKKLICYEQKTVHKMFTCLYFFVMNFGV